METKKINTREAVHLAVLTNIPTLLELEARKMLKALPVWIPKPKRVYKPRKKKPELRKLKTLEYPPAGFLYIYGKAGEVILSSNQVNIEMSRSSPIMIHGGNDGMCMPSRGRRMTADYPPQFIAAPPEVHIDIYNVRITPYGFLPTLGSPLPMKMTTPDGGSLVSGNVYITDYELCDTGANRFGVAPVGSIEISEI
jgi:hypothetical protein